jgi:hypothetical protein
MKIILLTFIVLIFILGITSGLFAAFTRNTYVIGGEYLVKHGETTNRDLVLVFAQVILEEGSHIEGRIYSISSTIDVCGTVAGNISSIESDITFEKTSNVKNISKDKDIFPFVLLLPRMARWNLARDW